MKQNEKIEKLNCYETNNTIHTCNFPSTTEKWEHKKTNLIQKILASFASPTFIMALDVRMEEHWNYEFKKSITRDFLYIYACGQKVKWRKK